MATITKSLNLKQNEPKQTTTTDNSMQNYLNEFYLFIKDIMLEYVKGKENNTHEFEKYYSFMEYMCYRLYGDFGIKRKFHCYGEAITEEEQSKMNKKELNWYKFMYGERLNPHLLIQFFYDKSIPSYNKSKSITRLCRHMIFDMKTFSIVSLGVLKSLDEDDFYNKVNKTETDGLTKYKVVVEEFLEGTMVIYNEGMSAFNYHTISKDEVENTKTDMDENQYNSNNKRKDKNFTISTRRKIGTSFFNKPGKTFYEMFQDNNEKSGVDFSNVDEEDLKLLSMVFNVEHEDNRIISPYPNNRNTLVGAYIFKPININKEHMKKLMDLMMLDAEITDEVLTILFLLLADKVVCELNVNNVKQTMKEKYNIELRIPETAMMLEDTNDNIHKLVSDKVSTLDEYAPGLMVRDYESTMRFKIRKDKYKELLELKGHTPISIHDKNVENLFKCYWRIRSINGFSAINKFLKVFDNKDKEYRKIFDDYKKKIHEFTHNLYIEYMSVFVDKKKHAREIPYILSPLIGDLHNEYKKNKKATTKARVVEYVNSMPSYKIYWRLFTPDINDTVNNKNHNSKNKKESTKTNIESSSVSVNSLSDLSVQDNIKIPDSVIED